MTDKKLLISLTWFSLSFTQNLFNLLMFQLLLNHQFINNFLNKLLFFIKHFFNSKSLILKNFLNFLINDKVCLWALLFIISFLIDDQSNLLIHTQLNDHFSSLLSSQIQVFFCLNTQTNSLYNFSSSSTQIKSYSILNFSSKL